ncbi:hypothetical protein DV515_00019796, partial [Chloebia gouldiae]
FHHFIPNFSYFSPFSHPQVWPGVSHLWWSPRWPCSAPRPPGTSPTHGPTTPRYLQVPPTHPSYLQVSPGAPRCPQVPPGVSRCPQLSPGVPRCPQVSPGAPRCPQVPPGVPHLWWSPRWPCSGPRPPGTSPTPGPTTP